MLTDYTRANVRHTGLALFAQRLFIWPPPHLLSSAEKSFEKKLGKIRAAFNVCKNIMLHCEWGQILYKTQYHYIFKCKDQVDNHTCLVKKIEGKNHYNKIFKSKN